MPYGDSAPYQPGGFTEPYPIWNGTWSYGISNVMQTAMPAVAIAMSPRTPVLTLVLAADDTIVNLKLGTLQSPYAFGAGIRFERHQHRVGGVGNASSRLADAIGAVATQGRASVPSATGNT